MINISADGLTALRQDATQKVKIEVEPIFGDPFTITDEDIVLNGFEYETHSVDGEELQIGNMTSAVIKVTLDNDDGRFDNVYFGGAILRVKIGVVIDRETTEYIPFGVYTVDEQPRAWATINLEAFDNMVKADIPFNPAAVIFPASLRRLISSAAEASGLEIENINIFPDDSVIGELSFSELPTWRQVMMWCCQCACLNGIANEYGLLEFGFYSNNGFKLSASDRYIDGTARDEADITISGHRFIDGENIYPEAADTSYCLETAENAVFSAMTQEGKRKYAEYVNSTLSGFSYLPYSYDIVSLPILQTLDSIEIEYENERRRSVITNIAYTLNGKMSIAGKGKSVVQKGYASLGVLTPRQRAVVERINKYIEATKGDISGEVGNMLKFNETIAYSLGLYTTVVQDGEGGQRIYYHDKEKLEDSGVIYTFGEGGFAWTKDGWNGGEPLWQYGTDKNGNAILNTIYAYSLTADVIKSGVFDGSLIRADSVQSSSISSHYKEEVTNEIKNAATEVEQAFSAADGELLSRISEAKSEVEGSIEKTETKLSELRQTVENLNIGFTEKTTGGINLIRNSSGLNGVSDDWEYTGVVTAEQSAETSSGSLFRLREGTLSQEITVIRDKTYTLSFKARRDTANRCYLLINNGVTDIFAFDKQEAGEWEEHSLTFTAAGSTVKLSAGTTGNSLLIADLMLVEGESKNYWTPAPNEVYTECVKIDRRGINIINGENSTQTVIDHREFAVKYKNETVLTVNKDRTSLRDTEIKGNLYISDKGKIAPLSDGPGFDVVVFD